MTLYRWTERQLEILNFETTYLPNCPHIPDNFKGYRKQVRKGVYNNMEWGDVLKRSPEKAVKAYIFSNSGRSQMSSFLHNVGLSSFAAQCPLVPTNLRQSLTTLSLDLATNPTYAEHEYVLDFVLKIYNENISSSREFWRAIYTIARLSQDSFQPPSSSPPPYASASTTV